MSSVPDVVKYLLLTDVHLGNPGIDPKMLHLKFKKYLYPTLKNINILVLGGDFWDTLLHMDSPSSLTAVSIIDELIEMAYEYDYVLRILRGTITHDRNQNQFFQSSDDGRIRTVNSIDIEYLERFDQWILYIPDDIPGDHMEIAKQKMRDLQLDKVDVIIHHGYFSHMLPPGIPMEPPHTLTIDKVNAVFSPIVVFNGHVHTPSVYRNVISGGSFERFAHGEEHNKGFFLIDVNKSQRTASSNFVINEDATVYATCDLRSHETVEAASAVFEPWFFIKLKQKTRLMPSIYVRILAATPLIAELLALWCKQQSGSVIVSKPPGVKKEQAISENKINMEELPRITLGNLTDLVFEHIKKQHSNITTQDVDLVIKMVTGGS